jgi:LysM repeat protein
MSSGGFGGNNFYFEAQSLGETGHQTYTIKSGDTLGSISKKSSEPQQSGKKLRRPIISVTRQNKSGPND